MFTGIPLFHVSSDPELFRMIRKQEWDFSLAENKKASENLLDLMRDCLKIDPKERITAL